MRRAKRRPPLPSRSRGSMTSSCDDPTAVDYTVNRAMNRYGIQDCCRDHLLFREPTFAHRSLRIGSRSLT
jgi:hypothetical protein